MLLIDNINYNENFFLEVIWIIFPCALLFFLLVSSVISLYTVDEIVENLFTVKIIGNQWFWNYEYLFKLQDSNMSSGVFVVNFDSNLILEPDLQEGQLRLLEVDHPLVLPTRTHIRLLITSNDVIHS